MTDTTGRYTKKPVTIDAMQWDGTESGCQAIKAKFPQLETLAKSGHLKKPEVTYWKIGTLEGGHEVTKGDWIIRGVKGEFYPCKPDVFEMTYQPAVEPSTGRYAPMPEPGDVRASGGIVHSDGNIFFTNIEKMGSLLRAYADATHALRAAQRPQDVPMWLKELGRLVVHYGNSCTAMGEDWSRVREEEVQEDRAALMAHAAQRPADSWRDAVQDELTTLHLSCPDDPRQAIKDMISWNCTIALDPAVSSDARALVERGRQEAQRLAVQDDRAAFERGDIVRKRSGSAWEGRVCGEYSTSLTPKGYAVESDKHPGSVQIYPEAALELIGRERQAALASRPVPPPISDEQIRAVGAEHYGTLMTEQEMRYARAVAAARDAQWKGGV